MSLSVPYATVREVVPDAFLVGGFVPGIDVMVLVAMQECPASWHGSEPLGPVHAYTASVIVRPVNESWSDLQLNYYILETASNNEYWNQALQDVDLPVVPAEISIVKHHLPTESFAAVMIAQATEWEITADFVYLIDTPERFDRVYHLWYGDSSIHRITENSTFESQVTPGAGGLVHQGESRLGAVLVSPVYPQISGAWRVDQQSDFRYDGTWAT